MTREKENNFSFFDSISIPGHWWLPGKDDQSVFGIVTFEKQNRISLELDGYFPQLRYDPFDLPDFRPAVICGCSRAGTTFALLDCFLKQMPSKSPGYVRSIFQAKFLVSGTQHWEAESSDNITFSSMRVAYPGLDVSLDKSMHFDSDAKVDEIEFSWRGNKKEIDLSVDGFRVKSGSKCTYSHDDQKLNAEHFAFLEFIPTEAQPLKWYVKKATDLQFFFSLLHGFPTIPMRVLIGGPVEFEHAWWKIGQSDAPQSVYYTDLFIQLCQCSAQEVETLLRSWFSKADPVTTVVELYCSTFFQPGLFTLVEFLLLVQALEAFQRATGHNEYMPKVVYKPIREYLKKSVPYVLSQDFRERIEESVQYANEFSQKTRLRLAIERLPKPLLQLVTTDSGKFATEIVRWRNYLTHYAPDAKKHLPPDYQITVVNHGLRVILRVLLLQLFGIPESLLLSATKRDQDLRAYLWYVPQFEFLNERLAYPSKSKTPDGETSPASHTPAV